MRPRGLEPPRPIRATRPSTLRVYQFRHRRGRPGSLAGPRGQLGGTCRKTSDSLPEHLFASRRPPGMDELTDRQTAILQFISRHCRDSGYPPTVREIGFGVGLASPSTVHAHLAKLEAAGHIHATPPSRARCTSAGRRARGLAAAPRPGRGPAPCRLGGRRRAAAGRAGRGGLGRGALRGRFRPQGERRVDDRRRDPGRRPRGGQAPAHGPRRRDRGGQIEDEATVKRLRRADRPRAPDARRTTPSSRSSSTTCSSWASSSG